ncbi:MAG: transcription-repair coupling factor, partial [Candidatus Margulisbacteria bacterium]|nr:transcription-repair coupling factor [Candidatus Margulisiibacteriota bacterium]
ESSYFQGKLADLKDNKKPLFSGLIGAARSAVIAALRQIKPNLLIVTFSSQETEKISREVELFSGQPVAIFPALDVLPGEELLPSKELVGQRLTIQNNWREGRAQVVVATAKAILQLTSRAVESIRISGDINRDKLIARLIEFGYKRFDIVGERGEFSVRGGIVDIFPINSDRPCRLELAGDRVESIRIFDPFSQRSVGKQAAILILPAVEKAEVSVIELVSRATVVALDEIVNLQKIEALNFSPLQDRADIELASFLGAGEEPLFTAPDSYLNKLEAVPGKALVISRHAARLKEELPEANIISGEISGGFVFNGQVIISDRELFGEKAPLRRKEAANREGVAEELLADLKIGDYIVHENYGIGVYQGMQTIELEGVKQEYLLIEYANEDKLYIPPAMAGLVEKFNGGREARPRLSRLGTKEWLKTRNNVKKALKDMTQELLALYAAREKFEGTAFPPDDVWQKELEATFPYDETPDQLTAINQVKKDMESARPMDRLVCGDVGYGKTEVAIRAAAKAAAAGKQVALLAPTTILVEQHYNNFKQRFQNLPFVVEMLSRFRSAKEQKEAVKLLAAGGVDIIIGTHRLLSKDVKFKNLGLLVIDEEQKFGVTHKEKIKQFKKTVDVLTLTATPIPRTLYFSLSGVRELSMIATPPVDRSPIRTHILPFSGQVIRESILREIDRGGQVYFLHNYVETIEGMASRIKKLVPEARVTIGHGQMDEKELEKRMLDFMERKYDVLVCTSIIESGLDITNVNTILIDQADRLGLSQLYQIRGRVGRSAVRAYAYLFYNPARSLSDQALERLKAIQEFTALGSGYKLAMRDLEIRGAGNLLGAQQSGHIYEVGFDLYCELLEEAVREIKGETVVSPREVEIDLHVEASIPQNYVTDDRQRIALYRRMNMIVTDEGITDIRQELEDRFGKVPPQVETLLRIVKLKVRSLECGVRSVKEKDNQIRIEYMSKKVKLLDVAGGDKIRIAMRGIAG